jgi:hypothetical protein
MADTRGSQGQGQVGTKGVREVNGLLGGFGQKRTCPHDKTELSKVEGFWKIDQVMQSPNKLTSNTDWVPTGFIFTAALYKCHACGYVEMVDEA